MTGNEKLNCCNGDCNQGRLCCIRLKQSTRSINWRIALHNWVHGGSFTLVEQAVIFSIAVALLILVLTKLV